MKYILQRILIGTGIAFAVWFIKDTCFAATTIQTYQYRTTYRNAVCITDPLNTSQYLCSPSGSDTTSSLTSFGTATAGPKYIKSNTINFVTPNDSSKMFIQGQQCQIKFTINWNPRNSEAISAGTEAIPTFQYYNGSDYVSFTDASLSKNLSSDNYGIDYFYNFTVPQTSRYMQVVLDYGSNGVLRPTSSQAMNVVKGSINCAQSSTDIAIQDAGNQITGAINGVGGQISSGIDLVLSTLQAFKSNFDSSMNSLFTELSDNHSWASTVTQSFIENTNYYNAGSQIGGIVGNGLNNPPDVDLTPWDDPFSFLWGIVNDIVAVDSKLFITFTTILTFSFVGLVFNR